MKSILVATDLSERSDRALERAALLARQFGARLHILYVVDDGLPNTIAVACESNGIEELERLVAENPAFKGVDVGIEVEFGQPWKVISTAARHHAADLIVLGTHRNRGYRELFGGTTLQRVAKTLPTPLLVVTRRATSAYARPIVGTDFSKCAEHAAKLAAAIAPGRPLTLVHAYHIPFKELTMRVDASGDVPRSEQARIEAELNARMQEFAQSLDGPQGGLQTVFVEGGPTLVLQAEIEKRDSDIVCVGSHGKPWLVETLLGSTAEELLSFPPCDVLIAPLK